MKPEHEKFMGARVKDVVTGASGQILNWILHVVSSLLVVSLWLIFRNIHIPPEFYWDAFVLFMIVIGPPRKAQ